MLSLLFGFSAIILSIDGYFILSALAIIFSVVFDGFDGELARQLNTHSEFGKELDSLVDVVSFGIAPSVLGYSFIYQRGTFLAVLVFFIYLLAAIIRLAKYNITPKAEMPGYFYGLPTTVAGGILASFVLICRQKGVMAFTGNLFFLFLSLVLLLSGLMLSRIHYLNLNSLRQLLGKKLRLSLITFSIVLAVAFYLNSTGVVLFFIFLIYLIFSPFMVKRLGSIKA